MIRVLAATVLLTILASPAFACPWTQTSSVTPQSTTAAAQPPAPANCPTCVVPGHTPANLPPAPQQPS